MDDLQVKGTVIICEDDIDDMWWASSLPADRFYDLIAEVISESYEDIDDLTAKLNKKFGNLARQVESDFTTSTHTILINHDEKTIAVGIEELMVVGWKSFIETRMEKAVCAS